MNIGFIGVGKIGREHARCARHLGHDVYAGYSKRATPESWREFHAENPLALFQDPHTMLHGNKIDLIVVAIPPDQLDEGLRESLIVAGTPLLVEKPFGLADYGPILKGMNMAGDTSHVKIAFNRRFYEPVMRLKADLLHREIKSIEVNISEPVAMKLKNNPKLTAKDVLLYSSIHALDLVGFLIDSLLEPKEVYHFKEKSGFTSITAICSTKYLDLPVVLNINEDDPINTGIVVKCEDGIRYSLTPLEKLTIYNGLSVDEDKDGNRIYTPSKQVVIEADRTFKPGFLKQMEMFTTNHNSKYLGTIAQEYQLRELIKELV
jgi:hypothetical protein